MTYLVCLKRGLILQYLNILNYKLIRKDRLSRGGGVVFYVKESIKIKVLKIPTTNLLEHLWFTTKIAGKSLCFRTVYRPLSNNLNVCLEELENIVSNLLPEYDHIGGDFNIDMENNCSPMVMNRFLNKYNLYQIITEPTRITDNSFTLIDLIIVNDTSLITESQVIKMCGISDHSLVTSKIKLTSCKYFII